MRFDSKAIIAVVVLLGCFGLLAPYVIDFKTPPDVILLIVAPAITGVIAYYFGAHNGAMTGLATAATQTSQLAAQLASQAIEKRSAPTTTVVMQQPPAAPPAGPSSA